MLKYFIFLSFALFIFSQTFFDIYKRDLPKSVLEGKYKIENIEMLVNEYAEISPLLIYSFIENLDKRSKNQQTEININQLRNQLLSIRKEWITSLLKDESLSDQAQEFLIKLYSTYSFSEIHQATINFDRYKDNAKFNYILAKHLAHEDFGVFNSTIDYTYFVTIQSEKKVNFLNRNFAEIEDKNSGSKININEYLYLVAAYPDNIIKIKTKFTLIEFIEAVGNFNNMSYLKSLDYYKENLDHTYSVSILFGSSVAANSPKTLGWDPNFYKINANSIKLQLEAKWQGNYKFEIFSYFSAFLSYDVISDKSYTYDEAQFVRVYSGTKQLTKIRPTYDEYRTDYVVSIRAFGEIEDISQLEYGLSAPILFSSLWSNTREDFFTFEIGFGVRHRFFMYTAKEETKDRTVIHREYRSSNIPDEVISDLYSAVAINEEKKNIHEMDFLYDLTFFLKPMEHLRLDLRLRNESFLFGTAYSF